MRDAWIGLLGLLLALSLIGCGGGQTVGEEEDLHKQWGPDLMPDRDAEPLQYAYWRVDLLFKNEDADGDGRLTPQEFGGQQANFTRIDANEDGFVTKKEVVDHMTAYLREQGKIP